MLRKCIWRFVKAAAHMLFCTVENYSDLYTLLCVYVKRSVASLSTRMLPDDEWSGLAFVVLGKKANKAVETAATRYCRRHRVKTVYTCIAACHHRVSSFGIRCFGGVCTRNARGFNTVAGKHSASSTFVKSRIEQTHYGRFRDFKRF